MATTPLLDSEIESRLLEQHAATLQFQRLERVRARQRSRHRVIVTTLGLALAGVGVLSFIVVRGTSFERLGHFRTQAPASMPAQGAVSTPATDSALSPTSTLVPPPAPADEVKPDVSSDVKPDVAQALRIQANGPPAPGLKSPPRGLSTRVVVPGESAPDPIRSNQLPDRRAGGVTDPSRAEQSVAEVVDPAAVIDWLLKASPRREPMETPQ
jgi:hypothetical protein